ncbi:hypothetical protein SAMN04488066_10858 [Halorubrum aquaticum]|uniref:Uncharacterized protein n=1 Tax=Halorubrum aquaticum TaxID=387340 RepID=A0A1I3AYR1_9EURY|nr:hypothetical protein [Halorubrum aquaticum]SFH55225.1 hypothetical protein SAMN04488066_10858 [Halorubrum aquaticum]
MSIAIVLLYGVVGFGLVAFAAFAGSIRALQVYFDPDADSYFLRDDHDPPGFE